MAGYYGSSSNYSFRCRRAAEDVDPMSSMGNIGDVMLVFACGLMVALVLAWNVDLGQFQQVEMDQELDSDDVTQMNEQLYGEGNSFKEMGTVYQDPETGKYYLVEEGTSDTAASDALSSQKASDDAASSNPDQAGGE